MRGKSGQSTRPEASLAMPVVGIEPYALRSQPDLEAPKSCCSPTTWQCFILPSTTTLIQTKARLSMRREHRHWNHQGRWDVALVLPVRLKGSLGSVVFAAAHGSALPTAAARRAVHKGAAGCSATNNERYWPRRAITRCSHGLPNIVLCHV